jgi:hypothetical protein
MRVSEVKLLRRGREALSLADNTLHVEATGG